MVTELVALKSEYEKKTGKPYGAAASGDNSGSSKKDKKPKKADVPPAAPAAPATPVVESVKPPAAPVVKPSYTSPKPVVRVTSIVERPDISGGVSGVEVNFEKLDARLRLFSYVGGYLPTTEDNS